MGGIFKDKVDATDLVRAELSTEVVDPLFPCPGCGMELKPTSRPEVASLEERICSSRICRAVSSDIVEAKGPKGSALFPCGVCGKETKVKAVAIAPHTERVCSSCRKIFEPV